MLIAVAASQTATIGIFLLLFVAFLYIGHAIVVPILAAAVGALTLAPLVKAAKAYGISPWISGILILAVGLGALSLAVTALAGPVSEWIGRAPEIGATIKEKLSVLDAPLASLRELENSLFGDSGSLNVNAPPPNVVLPVVAFLTPAAGESLLFFATLYFFLGGQIGLRNHAVAMFAGRDAKLRFLKIMRDIERNLAGYLTVVTIVNAAVGTIVRAEGAAAFRDLIESGRARELRAARDRTGGYVGYATPAVDYIDALRQRVFMIEAFDRAFGKYDAIVSPTLHTVAYPVALPFDKAYPKYRGGVSLIASGNLTGVPALGLPNGFGENGLPTGLSLLGRPFCEAKLSAIARMYQTRTQHHLKRPTLVAGQPGVN